MILKKGYILRKRLRMRIEILVREAREKKNIKFNTLAKLAGISKGTLSKIERQEQEPKLSTMILIARALKVEIKDLYKVHF
jgi:DNA-binding XRE family transcriptional regulator